MSGITGHTRKRLVGFLAFAYKTLILYFLFCAVLLFSVPSGAWFNYFIVFLILSSPLVLVLVVRRLLHDEGQIVTLGK